MYRDNRFRIKIQYKEMPIVIFYCFDLWYLLLIQVFPNILAKTVATVLLWGILLIAITKQKKVIKSDAIVLLILSYLLFIISYLIHPEYGYAMFKMPTWNIYASVFTFSSGIFAYLFFRIEENPVALRKYLKPAAYFCFIWGSLRIRSAIVNGGFTRIFENGEVSSGSYDMSVGYRFLFVCIVFFVEAMQEKRKGKKAFYFLMSAISAALMTVFGSRTAVVSLVLFWCLYSLLFRYDEKNLRELCKRIVFVLGLSILFLIITNQAVLRIFVETLQKLGLGSRMLDSLLSGGIELDLGRDRLWTMAYDLILKNPILGAGIYADRAKGGIYCHQILLEFLLDFGVIIGFVFICLMVYWSLKMLFRCRNRDWKLLFIMFFSMCFIRLNVSSSFWTDTNFWVCVALVVNYKKDSLRKGLYTYEQK